MRRATPAEASPTLPRRPASPGSAPDPVAAAAPARAVAAPPGLGPCLGPCLVLGLGLGLGLAVLPGCQGGPAPLPADTQAVLTEAERRLAEGEAEGCRDLLLETDEAALPRALQPRYEVALAHAHLVLGEPWDTFLVLRDFADDHPHSDLRGQAIDLQFEAGRTLAGSSDGFLFFWSAERRGRVVLEHLNTRYPDSPHLDDSLRILGEMSFRAGDYERAEQRFRELMRRRPESEWVPLARFRFAMSIFGSLRGPEYDLEQMQLATQELRAFLQDPPENPAFVTEAAEALQQLLQWRATRHVMIADFYRVVDNRFGEVQHLNMAIAPELADTAAAQTARDRLAALGEDVAPRTVGPPPLPTPEDRR